MRQRVGERVDERVGHVAQRQDRFVDTVARQALQHAHDHRLVDDRQHLLGRRQGEWAQPRPLTSREHDRPHQPDQEAGGRRAVKW